MEAGSAYARDWRDASTYAPLLDADRSLIAWEWLRRDPGYRAAFLSRGDRGGQGRARQFGLVAFEDPAMGVPTARPLWHADSYPYVLQADAGGSRLPGDVFDLAALDRFVCLIGSQGADHLLLSDGLRAIRLDAPRGSFIEPVGLRYWLGGLVSAAPSLLVLRRFVALCRNGRFSKSLHPREARARRWILALRARDALEAGAGQREIAEAILGRTVGAPAWRSREPSVRSQAQRLVRAARAMERGGYRSLLF